MPMPSETKELKFFKNSNEEGLKFKVHHLISPKKGPKCSLMPKENHKPSLALWPQVPLKFNSDRTFKRKIFSKNYFNLAEKPKTYITISPFDN